MTLKFIFYILVQLFTVASQDLNLREALINVRLASSNYNMDPSISSCVAKISGEFGMGPFNVLMEQNIFCDESLGNCRSVVVEFPRMRTIYFTYRGTTQPIQLLEEFAQAVATKDFLGLGQVNGYFVTASAALWEKQKAIVTNPRYSNYRFIYTGHSLGGALAVLGALRAIIEGNIRSAQVQTMTFGEPRIGHREFSRKVPYYLINDVRITNGKDVITRLPPCRRASFFPFSLNSACEPSFENSFYHHGVEYWFYNDAGADFAYKRCDGLPISEDVSCSARHGFYDNFGAKPLRDHLVYLNLDLPLYGMSGCQVPKILPRQ